MAAIAELSQIPSETVPELQGAYVSFLGPVPLAMLAVMILTSMGTWGLPQMVHKFYTIKNEKAIQAGTVISTIVCADHCGRILLPRFAFGRLFYTPGRGRARGL
ncbi:MAG: hypothetical protein ACOX4J_04620 [Anaerovoracaceae bacterium]